jgi:YggT family protein
MNDMAGTILNILLTLLQLLTYALIGRALLSWFDPRGQWAISRILADVTEPLIAPLRRVIPPVGMLDLSFIVAIILIQVLQRLLRQALL